MEFGYNTDVALGDGDYHVQTEGKFGSNPRVDTLVYKSGSVLHKLTRLQPGLSTAPAQRESSQKLIKKQHLRVVSMIRKGEFERLAWEVANPNQDPAAFVSTSAEAAAPAPPPPAASPPAATAAVEHHGDATVVLRRPVIPPRRAAPEGVPAPAPPPVPSVDMSADSFLEDGAMTEPLAAPVPEVTPEVSELPKYETVELAALYDVPVVAAPGPPSPPDPPAPPEREPPGQPELEEASFFLESDQVQEESIEDSAELPSPFDVEPPADATVRIESLREEPRLEEDRTILAAASLAPPVPAPVVSPPPVAPEAPPAPPAPPADLEGTVRRPPEDAEATVMGQPMPPPAAPPKLPTRPAPAAPAPRPEPARAPKAATPAVRPMPAPQVAKAPAKSAPERRMLLVLGAGAITVGAVVLVAALVLVSRMGGEDPEPDRTPPPSPTTPATAAPAKATPAGDLTPEATIERARSACRSGKADQALAALDRGLKEHGSDPLLLKERGLLLARMGRTDDAVLALRKLVDASPGEIDPLLMVGQAALQAGKASDVVWAMDELAKLREDPRAVFAHLVLQGRELFAQGKVEDAAAIIRQAIGKSPDDPRGHHAMGDILLAIGLKNNLSTFLVNARDYFEKARAKEPDNVDFAVSAARLALASKDPMAARSILEAALERDPVSYDGQVLLGVIALRRDDPAAALGPLGVAASLAPSRSEAHMLAGTAAARSGQDALAVDHFLAGLSAMARPDYVPDPDVHASRDAVKSLVADAIKKTLQKDPDHANALKLLDITVDLD